MKNYINSQGFVSVTDTSDILYIQENVQLTGSLSVSGSFSVGNVTMKNARGPKIVVGNSLAGDTLNDCDYLDAGDGVQLQAALTAAGVSPRKDVWLRPGTITCATPINVPTQVALRGAGMLTTLRNTPLNRQVLICNVRSMVTDFSITSQAPTTGCTGTEMVRVFGNATLARMRIALSSSAVGIATLETITALIREDTTVANYSSVSLINMETVGYSFRRLGLARDLVGIELTNFGDNAQRSSNTLVDTSALLCDIGFDLRGPHNVSACEAQLSSRIGAVLQTEAGGRNGSVVHGCMFNTLALTGTPQFGIVVGTGANASGLLDTTITGCKVDTTSVEVTSAGISLQGTGSNTTITGCSIGAFPLGVTVSATQTNVTCDVAIRGATTNYVDASGTANFAGRTENIGPFSVTTAATQTDAQTSFGALGLGWVAPRAGSITAFSANLSVAFATAGGSFVVQKALAASPTSFTNVAATQVSFTAGGSTVARTQIVRDTSTFAAGDVLRVVYTTAGITNTPTAAATIEITT